MDKIWDRKSFEVGGHWPLWRGWKNEWPRRTDKSGTLKIREKKSITTVSLKNSKIHSMALEIKRRALSINYRFLWKMILITFSRTSRDNVTFSGCKCGKMYLKCVREMKKRDKNNKVVKWEKIYLPPFKFDWL